MRVHARLLDARRLTVMAAALAAAIAPQILNDLESADTPAYAPAQVLNDLGSADTQAYVPAPSATETLADLGEDRPKSVGMLDYSLAAALLSSSSDLRPAAPETVGVDDPSSVFLFVTGADGTQYSGSGTIITGVFETHRVLTAGHVLIDVTGDVEEVIAFSGEGRALARLEPVATPRLESLAANGRPKHLGVIVNDVGALAVTELFESREDWNERGVRLAASQPAHPLLVANGLNSMGLNSGASGAGLRNAHNEVVAVFNYGGATSERGIQLMRSEFLDKVEALNPGPLGEVLGEINSSRTGLRLDADVVGAATPVIQPDILEALGVEGVVPDPDIGAFRAAFYAFPAAEGVSAEVFASPLTAHPATPLVEPLRLLAAPAPETP